MSHIAIKDLDENVTLDQAAMSEFHGGKGGHCSKGAPGDFSPASGHRSREHKSFDLKHMGAAATSQIDDLLNIGPLCGPMDVVR